MKPAWGLCWSRGPPGVRWPLAAGALCSVGGGVYIVGLVGV